MAGLDAAHRACRTLPAQPLLASSGALGQPVLAARNATFAAQTLMLAAAAKGVDSCPMEGFSAPKLVEILSLPRGTVIPLVIALGYRSQNARIERQWRRSLTDLIVEH